MKLLINCQDDFEADLIEGLLRSVDIPVYRKYRGAGQALKVYTGIGHDVDIYVPSQHLENARLLLESRHELDE